MSDQKVSSLVVLLSGLSAWSLLLLGSLSLLVSVWGGAIAGVLVGGALVGHGGIELKQRSLLIERFHERAAGRLAYNQLALAGSVLLYLGWQAFAIDPLEIEAILARDPIRSLLEILSPEIGEMLRRDLSKFLLGVYGVAGVFVLLGCFGMAVMYRAAKRSSQGN